MKLIEKVTSNSFIFVLVLLLSLALGGFVLAALILVFGMGASGIVASLLGLYIFRQQLKMKVEQGGKITMFDKAIQAGAIAMVFLIALTSLTPWFAR